MPTVDTANLPPWAAAGSPVVLIHRPHNIGAPTITETLVERLTRTTILLANGTTLRMPEAVTQDALEVTAFVVGARTRLTIYDPACPAVARARAERALEDARMFALIAADKSSLRGGHGVDAEQARNVAAAYLAWANLLDLQQ